MRIWYRWLLGLVALAVVAGAIVWFTRRGDTSAATAVVTRGNLAQAIETTGTFQPAQAVTVRGAVSGVVTLVAVQPGDEVQQGDIVAQLDRAPYQHALAAAQQSLAAAEFAETIALATPTAGAVGTMADALNALQHVSAAQAAVATAQSDLEQTAILAPATGKVLAVPVGTGDAYQAGAPLATINQGNRLQLEADLDEVDVPHVPLGTRVEVVADAFPGTTLHGTVASIAQVGAQQGGGTVFPATITLAGLDGLDVRPGMTAAVSIPSAAVTNAVLVPAGAITTVGRRSFVTVVSPGNTRTVEVTTGLRANGLVQIAAGDVHPGDRVQLGG